MKRILLVASIDRSANQERAEAVARALRQVGFRVTIFDVQREFRHMVRLRSLNSGPINFMNYLGELLSHKMGFKTYPVLAEIKLRAKIIKAYARSNKCQLVICQTPQDMLCLLGKNPFRTVLDSPTIYADELMSLGYKELMLTIKKWEDNVWQQTDLVSLQWHTYFDLAKKQGRLITNPTIADWGCEPTKVKASFFKKPKIVYLGKLNAPWINPDLLVWVARHSLFPLDIYSYERPDDKRLLPFYRGKLKNLNRLADYQFGLITIDKSRLRRYGFSAKHLRYLSLGLPILCPDWRHDKVLTPATIGYNHANFNQVLKRFSKREAWQQKHQAALKLAKSLSWSRQLKQFVSKVSELVD